MSEQDFNREMLDRVADDERRTIRMKLLGAELIRAVMRARVEGLPEDVKEIRGRIEREMQA